MRGIALLFVLVFVSTACGAGSFLGPAPTKDPFTGVYIARGGGGALDAILPLTKAFTAKHPGVTWQGLDDIGSDAGIKLVQSGDIDLAFISRDLKAPEVGTVLTQSIGASGTAIAVSASNPVNGLTKDQLRKIYTGAIANWRDVGGDNAAVRILLREPSAATRTSVESYVFGTAKPSYAKDAVELNSYDEIVKAMKSFPGAFGTVSMSAQAFNEPAIKFLSIDGIPATRVSLAGGGYPMRRPLYLVTSADPAKVRPALRAFLDFVKSPEGQAILDSV
jgi:phosphate transport system substrate-binding protein